jgi:hypothetical protein
MATQSGSAWEVVGSRGGSSNIENGTREATTIYRVQFTDGTAYSYEAENATGVPVMGAQLGSTGLYVVEKTGKPDTADQTIWTVEVKHKTLNYAPGAMQPNINPTQSTWSIVKAIKSFATEEAVQVDLTGKIVQNCLGEAMNPPVTALVYDEEMTIEFLTTATTHQAWIGTTISSCNSESITLTIGCNNHIFLPGELFFKDYSKNEAYVQNGTTSAQVRASQYHYDFLWRSGGWADQRANLSLMWAPNGTSGTLTTGQIRLAGLLGNGTDADYLSANGTTPQFVTEPQFLDANGKPIAHGGTITLNIFTMKGTASFASLLSLLSG